MLAVPEQEKGISDIDVLICLPTAWMWKLGLRLEHRSIAQTQLLLARHVCLLASPCIELFHLCDPTHLTKVQVSHAS